MAGSLLKPRRTSRLRRSAFSRVMPVPEPILAEILQDKYIPRATYRIQFGSAMSFIGAEKIAGYLKDLGISDIYASPLFRACPGSTHGYDATCFQEINP